MTSWTPTEPTTRDWTSPHRDWPTWAVLLGLTAATVLFLGLLHLGQRAMCSLHEGGMTYCPGTSTPTIQESS